MSGPEYWRMVLASYTDASGKRTLGANPDPYKNKDPWPVRVWPSRGSTGVDTIEAKFKKLWRNPVRMEILSPKKIVAITPKRTRGQAQVMGYTSATDVAKTLWPHYLTTPGQVRLSPKWNVEWLHRVAHSYAGDQGQHKSNLIFGTSECNTDMIRSEILVRRFVLLAPDHWQLILRTIMKDTLPHGHVRWCDEFILDQGGGDMPVEPDKYAWATPFLEYKFVMSIPSSTIVESWDVYYDTMSRYVPLRLEVDIDEILMNRFMDSQIARFVGK
ncbi:hypothetical protein BC629DRAFT_277973 [Irpex lacteus]|nr:hypothetical protein BC629DRAFT_277973 [Irpex lacteus]